MGASLPHYYTPGLYCCRTGKRWLMIGCLVLWSSYSVLPSSSCFSLSTVSCITATDHVSYRTMNCIVLISLVTFIIGHLLEYDVHVLRPLLPYCPAIPYSLRERSHNKTLLNKTIHLNDDDFLIRMLYKHLYWKDWYCTATIVYQCSIYIYLKFQFCMSCVWQFSVYHMTMTALIARLLYFICFNTVRLAQYKDLLRSPTPHLTLCWLLKNTGTNV